VNTHPNHLEAKDVLTKCVTRSVAGVPFLTHGSHKKLVIEIKPRVSGTADRLMQILKTNTFLLKKHPCYHELSVKHNIPLRRSF